MSGIAFLAVVSIVVLLALIIFAVIDYEKEYDLFDWIIWPLACFSFSSLMLLIVSICQPISLGKERIKMGYERDLIIYQISLVCDEPSKDRVALDNRILEYDSWINEIEVEQDVYGWYAWHWGFDMSEFYLIPVV